MIAGDGLSVLVRTFASGPILDVTDNLTGGFNETIRNNLDPTSPSVRDAAEGSDYYNTIRNFASSKPKILAWGDEDSPVHIRMFVSTITFDENFDNLLTTAYNQVTNGYRSGANMEVKNSFWCGKKCQRRRRREKEAWAVGANYLERGWEIAWNQLTDARVLERYTITVPVYVCPGSPNPVTPTPIEQPICDFDDNCDDCYWGEETVTRTRWVNQPSDGLIKRSSQVGAGSRWGGQEARLPGVNHVEMGVHPETNDLLQDAFTGRGGRFSGFFVTPGR